MYPDKSPGNMATRVFTCWHCSTLVSSQQGFQSNTSTEFYICPHCDWVNQFWGVEQFPSPMPGNPVGHLPDDVSRVYNEARKSLAGGAPTGAAMLARSLLMHVAVHRGAQENLRFVQYVNYLVDNHIVPAGSKSWVDHIRDKGNAAAHELLAVTHGDAAKLLRFAEHLLRSVYELPADMKP